MNPQAFLIRRFRSFPFASLLVCSIVAPVSAQNLVDFREVVRSAEPSLLTVISSADPSPIAAVDDAAVEGIEGDGKDEDAAGEDQGRPAGPRIEWLGQEDFDGAAPDLAAADRETVSAAFAIDESSLIAYAPHAGGRVRVENRDGEAFDGQVVASDAVTGLAVIRVDRAVFASLVVSTAFLEPGMPVIAIWNDEDVTTVDAAVVATRPRATGSGIGLSPKIDFGSGGPMTGAPLMDAEGTVVGAIVPGRQGDPVCVPSSMLLRLIRAASADPPHDLKRGLVGIQFQGGGPLVLEVTPQSGASTAGIQAGDLVEQVDGTDIRDADDVVAAVASARAGDTLQINVRRGDESLSLSVVLGEHPQQHVAMSGGLRSRGPGGVFRWDLDNGQRIPPGRLPDDRLLPPGLDQFPLEDLFRRFPMPGNPDRRFRPRLNPNPAAPDPADDDPADDGDLRDRLRELQRQMERLNERLDD